MFKKCVIYIYQTIYEFGMGKIHEFFKSLLKQFSALWLSQNEVQINQKSLQVLPWLGSLISSAFAFPTPPITFSSLESIPHPPQSSFFSLCPGTKPALFCSFAFDQLSSTAIPSLPPCLPPLTRQLRWNFVQRSCFG